MSDGTRQATELGSMESTRRLDGLEDDGFFEALIEYVRPSWDTLPNLPTLPVSSEDDLFVYKISVDHHPAEVYQVASTLVRLSQKNGIMHLLKMIRLARKLDEMVVVVRKPGSSEDVDHMGGLALANAIDQESWSRD